MIVLIVITEPSVPDAMRRLFTRLGFILLPLSVLFIKYYPLLGRKITLSWTTEWIGAATQKNSLGELCDIFGLVFLWRFRSVYNDRHDPQRRRRLLALGTTLVMVVWLLWMCNSMTSICALSMASIVMLFSKRPAFRRRPKLIHLLIASLLSVTMYALFFESSGSLIQGLGRNPTLTGRTDLWQTLIAIPTNRLVGAGYESFWLGSRLQKVWDTFPGGYLSEAHNGYIEILLTLGWIGVVLLGALIATGYRNAINCYRRDPDFGTLKLAFFMSAIITGLTEAAFRMLSPPWIVFLFAIVSVPVFARRKRSQSERTSGALPKPAFGIDIVREETPVG